MRLTKNGRGAVIAMINSIAARSEWFALPVDEGEFSFVYVHKRAATLFGKTIQTAQFFSSDGGSSELATAIHRIAKKHGYLAKSAKMTACPILVEASEVGNISGEDYA